MIANFVFGKRFATCATASAIRKPTPITSPLPFRAARVRFGT